jgi:hypothetical protein
LQIDDSTRTATLTLKTTGEDSSTKDEKNADITKEEANITATMILSHLISCTKSMVKKSSIKQMT